jgi:hypothetical protein
MHLSYEVLIRVDLAIDSVCPLLIRKDTVRSGRWKKLGETMFKYILPLACLFGVAGGSSAFAASDFPNSCSQIAFAYSGNAPTISAVCLRANGTANPTSLTIQGIGNQNGVLTTVGGASTFQSSCGNIEVAVDGTNVKLTGYCRNSSGASAPSSIPLNNIRNNNGVLSQ